MNDTSLTWKGRAIAILLGIVFVLAIFEGVLRIVNPFWDQYFSGRFITVESVPEHGVVAIGRAGFDGYFAQNNGDFRVHISINQFGTRNNVPVEAANDSIWVIGDSMTFGWGVEADEMYSAVIAQQLDKPTYNVASPGTSVCGYQALTARMPASVKPSAVVVGLILENDVTEYDCVAFAKAAENRAPQDTTSSVSDFAHIKGFLTRSSATYNFFAVSLKRVDVVRELLIWAGLVAKQHAYQKNFGDEQIGLYVASTADELLKLRKMYDPKTPFVVLIAPARFEIADQDPTFATVRKQMRDALKARGIDFVDPAESFIREGLAATHFAHDGHWSTNGHKIAGSATADWLRQHMQNP
tara:strand:+ start:1980 stop:3044 length:1065 start_codon:yes stop_codon:yes gene_type:complete